LGFLKSVFHKESKKKHSLGVCIPDSSRAKKEEKAEIAAAVGKIFKVEGVFHVHDSIMVKGKASAKIEKKDKASFQGMKLVVKDVQVGSKNAEYLEEGQAGALFLRAENGKNPIIKIDDVLKF